MPSQALSHSELNTEQAELSFNDRFNKYGSAVATKAAAEDLVYFKKEMVDNAPIIPVEADIRDGKVFVGRESMDSFIHTDPSKPVAEGYRPVEKTNATHLSHSQALHVKVNNVQATIVCSSFEQDLGRRSNDRDPAGVTWLTVHIQYQKGQLEAYAIKAPANHEELGKFLYALTGQKPIEVICESGARTYDITAFSKDRPLSLEEGMKNLAREPSLSDSTKQLVASLDKALQALPMTPAEIKAQVALIEKEIEALTKVVGFSEALKKTLAFAKQAFSDPQDKRPLETIAKNLQAHNESMAIQEPQRRELSTSIIISNHELRQSEKIESLLVRALTNELREKAKIQAETATREIQNNASLPHWVSRALTEEKPVNQSTPPTPPIDAPQIKSLQNSCNNETVTSHSRSDEKVLWPTASHSIPSRRRTEEQIHTVVKNHVAPRDFTPLQTRHVVPDRISTKPRATLTRAENVQINPTISATKPEVASKYAAESRLTTALKTRKQTGHETVLSGKVESPAKQVTNSVDASQIKLVTVKQFILEQFQKGKEKILQIFERPLALIKKTETWLMRVAAQYKQLVSRIQTSFKKFAVTNLVLKRFRNTLQLVARGREAVQKRTASVTNFLHRIRNNVRKILSGKRIGKEYALEAQTNIRRANRIQLLMLSLRVKAGLSRAARHINNRTRQQVSKAKRPVVRHISTLARIARTSSNGRLLRTFKNLLDSKNNFARGLNFRAKLTARLADVRIKILGRLLKTPAKKRVLRYFATRKGRIPPQAHIANEKHREFTKRRLSLHKQKIQKRPVRNTKKLYTEEEFSHWLTEMKRKSRRDRYYALKNQTSIVKNLARLQRKLQPSAPASKFGLAAQKNEEELAELLL